VYTSLLSRDSALGRASGWASRQLTGRTDTAMPPMRGIGPTLIPRPRRMYLSFGPPIDTTAPADVTPDAWAADVKRRVEDELGRTMSELRGIQAADPYRHLNPLAWRTAVTS
jgi:hypothetical protein